MAPSAPDPLSGCWCKYDVVCRVLAQSPQRPVVWVDDELHYEAGAFRRWAEEHPDLLPVGPDPMRGLVRDDLDDKNQKSFQTASAERSPSA